MQSPEDESQYIGVVDVSDKAVITSGGYERYFEQDGKIYHHIIDPATGYPAESGLKSVTIVSDDGTLADGLSTSLFIMGKDKACEFWKAHSDEFDFVLLTDDDSMYISAVVIQDKTLKAILVTEKQDDEPFITNAMDVLKNMMKKQSADVDTVSGATYSSKGLIGAVKAAFEEARKTTAGENTGGSNSDSNNSNDNNSNIAGEEDKAVLLKLVQSQASLDGAQYTQLSWYLLQIRLGDAQEVLESAESTKKDVSCAQEKLQAAINALQKNDTSTNVYEDGTYDVSTLCIPDDDMDFSAYNLSMKVTIANDRIVSITDVKGDGDSQNVSYIKKAVDGTKNQAGMVSVLTSQTNADSIDFSSIDTVSHATCTSKAIIDGCKSALEAAKKK